MRERERERESEREREREREKERGRGRKRERAREIARSATWKEVYGSKFLVVAVLRIDCNQIKARFAKNRNTPSYVRFVQKKKKKKNSCDLDGPMRSISKVKKVKEK